jgi:diguanylate cyclase (GGDEF)-like protein/PAS domain S-box-containing protein
MSIRRIRHKLLIALALALSLGFAAVAYFYTQAVEESIIKEYRRTLHRLTDSVVMSIETIMSENHAEIMPEYARRLKALPGLVDFRVARADGREAYLDNATIDAVNGRLGEALFQRRKAAAEVPPVFDAADPALTPALQGREAVMATLRSAAGENLVRFYNPIPAGPACRRCHGQGETVRGILAVTTSMADVERDMMRARLQSLAILTVSLVLTMAVTGYLLGRFVSSPIEAVTRAMARISGGDLDSHVETTSRDELGDMARSFNKMTADLRRTYSDMRVEKDKLSTVIQGAQEAVVVTDDSGAVVLVNGAAEEFLGKSEAAIREGGILNLMEQPERFRDMLDSPDKRREAVLIDYNGRALLTSVTTIRDDDGHAIGSAALMRDVTLERRLLDELERISTTDALTGVYNRRHLDSVLATEMNRSREAGLPLAVIMFDADHFKQFNDTYGHDQGDRVLKMLGQVMRTAVRKYDVPCRYGGEEFVVVLPSTDAAGALVVAERLRLDTEAMRVDGLQVTISLGVACWPDVAAATPEALMLAADAALYRSKAGGRNRTTLAGGEMAEPTG